MRPRYDRDEINRRINITYMIEEGPRVYIERINIVGNFRTHDDVIRREFSLAEGDAFNRLLVEAARRRLRSLGFFKTVEIDTEPGSAPDRVIVIVRVQEQPTGELSFGAGYSTSEGVIGDISIAERNLMGKGQYVRLGFSGSLERAQVDFSFTEPHFLDRNLAAGFDLFHKEVDFTNVASYRERNTGGNLRMGFPIAFNTQLGLRYRLEREEIYDVANNASLAVKAAEGESIVSSVGFTVAYDTRNLPQSPTSGVFASFSEDLAGVGGDVNYFRSVVDGRGYYPVTPKITLVGRGQAGYISGWGGEDVRMTDLFFKGGETIRGFERAGIGPRDACENAITGKRDEGLQPRTRWADRPSGRRPPNSASRFPSFLTISACRAPYSSTPVRCGKRAALPWRPLPTKEASSIDTADVRMSSGVSIIWQSPLGPLRADLAQALLKASYDRTELFRFGASTAF